MVVVVEDVICRVGTVSRQLIINYGNQVFYLTRKILSLVDNWSTSRDCSKLRHTN